MMLKRIIISLLILTLILLSVFNAIPVCAEFEYSYFLFRTENFSTPEPWTLQNDASKYLNALPGKYLKASQRGIPPAETNIFITDEGEYVIWAMVFDGDDAYFGQRHALISVDGEVDDQKFGSVVRNGFSWSRSKKAYYLTPGLHTIGVNVGTPSTCCSAVFVTNDLDFVLNEETQYGDIEQYTDLQKPVFSGEFAANKESSSSFTVTFPTATDNNGVAGYQYFMDGEQIEIDENNSYHAEGLLPLSSHSVKIKAFDNLGNISELEYNIKLYDWEIKNIQLQRTNGANVSSLSEVAADDTGIKIDVSAEKHLSGLQRLFMFAGIYTKDESRMVSYVMSRWNATGAVGATISKNVELSLEPDVIMNPEEYIIKVILIDSNTNIMPYVNGSVIGEAVVSQ